MTENLGKPLTEQQVANLIWELEGTSEAMIVRRLAFERDSLKAEFTGESSQPPLEMIRAKCEQYWNEASTVFPTELHSILEFIHRLARSAETDRLGLQIWVDDLQSEMCINCVYCGHRYGPQDDVPASMADVLKAHVEQCSKHPMSQLRQDNERLQAIVGMLPKTADGVTILPGMTVWQRETRDAGRSWHIVEHGVAHGWPTIWPYPGCIPRRCYSTREAGENWGKLLTDEPSISVPK